VGSGVGGVIEPLEPPDEEAGVLPDEDAGVLPDEDAGVPDDAGLPDEDAKPPDDAELAGLPDEEAEEPPVGVAGGGLSPSPPHAAMPKIPQKSPTIVIVRMEGPPVGGAS
jgi:hypothetical protein